MTENLELYDVTMHLIQQVNTFEPTIVLGQEIEDLERRDDGTFVLTSTAGDRHWTRTIIMAIGFGRLRKPVKIEIDGAKIRIYFIRYIIWKTSEVRGY